MLNFEILLGYGGRNVHAAVKICVLVVGLVITTNVHAECTCCDHETSDCELTSQAAPVAILDFIAWDIDESSHAIGDLFSDFRNNSSTLTDRRRFFPIGNQLLDDLGYPMPLPFGISANTMYSDQPFDVERVQVGVGGLPPLPATLVDVPALQSRTTSATVRGDCWVLPILNIYGFAGYTTGITTGEVVVSGVTGAPGLLRIPVRTEFEGPTYGGGFTAVVGYKKFFASVDWHYAEVQLDIANSSTSTETTSPRIGLNGPRGSLWVGASYENVQEQLAVSNQVIGALSVDTITDYRTANPWNFIYGCRYIVSDHLELFVEHGFGGRNQVMGNITLRL